METYGLSQTESLLKDLSSETLTSEYNSLKAKYDELYKREQQSRFELERTQTLLEESQKTAAANQREKEAVENKMVDITNNKHESVSLVSDLRQSLALLRSENAKLSQENKEKYMKIIMIQTDKDAEHYQNVTLKVQVNDLHVRLNNLIKNEEGTRQSLLAAESELRLQSQSKQREREHYISQKNFLENERDTLSSTVHELRQEMAKLKTDVECANERAKAAEERQQKLETNRIATKKNHDDLLAIYEKQRLEAEQKIANFSADLEIIQQKATSDQKKLAQENKALQDQLTEALDRIQVTRHSLGQLMDERNSPGTTPTESTTTDNNTTTTAVLGGNLLKMMKQYQSTGKHWDDIYSDFFGLRDSTTRLTATNADLVMVNKQLLREQDGQQQYLGKLESELDKLRSELTSQSSLADNFAKLKSSSTQQIKELQEKVADLEHSKQDLDASLNDTTYQLRFLLRHVESQYGTLPQEVQETNDLLGNASIPSTLGHDKTIFRDISELQQRNQDLMTEVHHLSTELKTKTAEAYSHAVRAKDNYSLLTDSSSKSTALIRDQKEKIQALELRLSKLTSERDQLLEQLPESPSNITSSSSIGIKEDQNVAERKYQGLSDEFETYRQQMEPEVQNLKERIQKVTADAMVCKQNYNRSLVEINELKQRNIGLTQVSNSRQTEIDDLRRRATTRDGHIGDLESRILSLNNEIMNITRQVENSRTENSSITAQLNASNASYQRLMIENKELANERMNLTTLLQNMNDSLGSSTSGSTHLMEELKQHNERLSRELQHIRDTLASKEKELRGYQAIDQREWKDKYQTTSGELKQLKTTYLELEKQLASANQDRIIAQTKLMEALQNTQASAGDGGSADTSGSTREAASNETVSDQIKQLTEANNQVASLKKDLFDFKERLANADETVNKITQEYNTFASESQIRIDKLSDDLAESNQKVDSIQVDLEKALNEQKDTKAAHYRDEQQWESTKSTLVHENDQLQANVVSLSTKITELQAELDTNVQHLQQSEERYQAEMSSHAKDADTIATLRDEVNRLNMDISTSKSEVLGAQERIRSVELSYRNQKEQLEATQNDMKLRLEESQKQQEALSTTIHELLSKINELQTAPNSVDSEVVNNLSENATQQLRDVSASLRREKDIWQARYSDAQQRVNRVESDLEFVQHQLSTTRALLEAVRAEKEESAKKQLQGIKDARTDAALYKESNASLRNNVEQLKDRITQLESFIATKEAEVEPLTLKAQGLEHELNQTKALVETLEAKQAAWTLRSNLILSKHNKTDPQELEQLKTELETAKTQVEEKTKSLDVLDKQYQELLTKTTQTEEQLKKITDTANQRGKLAYEYRKKATDLEAVIKAQKEQQSEQQKEQEKSDASEKTKELEEALKKEKEDHVALSTRYNNLLAKARQLSGEKKNLTEAKTDLTAQLEAIKTEIEQTKQQLTKKTEESSSLQVEIGRMKAMESMTTNKNEKLKKELAALQQKLEGSASSPLPQGDKKPASPVPAVTPPPTTTAATPLPPSSPATASTLTATAPVFTPTSTPTAAVVSSPLSSQESPAPTNGDTSTPTSTTNTTTTTAAVAAATTPNESTEANTLKRAPEDDLEGQSPTKK